jgi:restriction system protein
MAKKVSKSRYKKSIPEALDLRENRKFLRAFFTSSDSKKVKPAHTSSLQNGLLEQMEKLYHDYQRSLAADLLQLVRKMPPDAFERLSVHLLSKMGYGNFRANAGRVVGKSGDGGIDGIIEEDPLGLEAIYIQAKRWSSAVGRPHVQKFVGALQAHGARKGIFITTAHFTREAKDYVAQVKSARVFLIDGDLLTKLMINLDIGVVTAIQYSLKRIDPDFAQHWKM